MFIIYLFVYLIIELLYFLLLILLMPQKDFNALTTPSIEYKSGLFGKNSIFTEFEEYFSISAPIIGILFSISTLDNVDKFSSFFVSKLITGIKYYS